MYAQSSLLDSLADIWSSPQSSETDKFNSLIQHSEKLRYIDTDSSITLGARALRMAYSSGLDEFVSRAQTQLGSVLYLKGLHDSASFHLFEGNRLAIKSENKKIMANSLTNIALFQFRLSEYEVAIDSAKKATLLAEESQDSILILRCHNNVGAIYWSMSEYVNAMDQFLAALGYAEKLNERRRVLYIHSNIGKCYAELNMLEEAIEHYTAALQNVKPHETRDQMILLMNLGETYFSSGNHELARSCFNDVLAISKNPDHCIRAVVQINLVKILIEEERFPLAQSILDSLGNNVYDHCDQGYMEGNINLYTGMIEVHLQNYSMGIELIKRSEAELLLLNDKILASEILAKAYAKSGKTDSAYARMEKLLELLQEKREVEQSIGIAKAEYQFNNRLEDERQRVGLLELESKVLRAEKSKLALWIGSIGALVLCIVLFYFYHRQRSARRVLEEQNRTITAQQNELQIKANLIGTSYSRIQQLSDFREQLAHMAVHDMKNPLHNVIGLASLEPSQENLSQIRVASQQMLNFLTNMLDIYKFEQAHISLNQKDLNICAILNESLAQVSSIAQANSVSIKSDCREELNAYIDESIMVRVLVNLLTNAIKYSKEGSEVMVRARESNETDKERGLIVEVSDQGEGINKKIQESLFKDIKDKASVHIDKSHSTGIGLNFCKLAIEAHKGKIEITSEEGKGTTATLFIPQNNPKESAAPSEDVTISEESLILEEEIVYLTKLAEELTQYKVYEVGSITKVLNRKNTEKLNSPWVAEIRTAVYIGNSDQYEFLVEMLTKNETR